MGNFDHKAEYSKYAYEHTNYMAQYEQPAINYSIQNSVIFDDNNIVKYNNDSTVFIEIPNRLVLPMDTVSALFYLYSHGYGNNITLLNFASYKYPGGMFLKGSDAQEESLCRESFLYNVLSSPIFKPYYDINKKNLNNGLYLNRAIYSPSIKFIRQTTESPNPLVCYANVVTCAAPNKRIMKYNSFNKNNNSDVLRSRIEFVMNIMRVSESTAIILGAFGCGVFEQDAKEVANYFKEFIYGFGDTLLVFAVPDENSYNYKSFVETVIC